jgi:hypothetical protein
LYQCDGHQHLPLLLLLLQHWCEHMTGCLVLWSLLLLLLLLLLQGCIAAAK